MDLKTGTIEMVSTGDGVTTCSFFEYPKNDKIIYASTHHYAKPCPPKPDFSRGYVWKLYESYDIFAPIWMALSLNRLPMKMVTTLKQLLLLMEVKLYIRQFLLVI